MLNHVIRRLTAATSLALLFVALGTTRVSGHIGGSAFILVPADHISPGSSFEVIAVDLGPGSAVLFEIRRDEQVVPLGEVSADSFGHFEGPLLLPGDFPQGYAELIATSSDGTQVATWVLVGPRTASTGAPPGPAWWTDPSVVVLGLLVVGGIGVFGYLLLQRGTNQPAPVRAARRPLPSKRRRARTS